MKNQFSILLILSIIFFSSCSEDDENGSEFGDLPEELLGTWGSVDLTSTGCTTASDNGSCSVGCLTVTFSSGGIFTGQFYNEVIGGTVTANDNTLKLCDSSGFCNEITYSISGDLVEITWTDSIDGCTYKGVIALVGFPSELVGTWISNSASATGCDDSSDNGTCEQDCLSYTFQTTGAFNGTFANEPERTGFGYTIGSDLFLCWSGEFSCQEISYSVSGDSGSVSWEDNEDGCSYEADISKQ
ncbi:hypothetical protein SAMN04488029_0857 [Reichenbachiella faecimaris]|uniref:Lipocalin-like domain-containing protein n=1 Tax=Reichenbachiella faecimaris TaxID=692418 RepID=A0A1W2G7V7_REIFA|nr:hypothetical protein [Reichenbachiella faecimaris]SMD32512.1 hypothetical protein SAMN04488029_0857 [Reichenbachiella faecimaris]